MKPRTKQLIAVYALLLLVPSIIPFCIHVFCRPHYLSLGTSVCAGILTLLGPWATLAAKITNIPNAGEIFYPKLAIGLTIAALTLCLTPILITNKWVTVACITLYVLLCFFWLFIGFGQLASCIL
jgi:hypothetical protein